MEKNYFEFSDILAFMLWLAIILIYASNQKGKIKDDNLKGYFNQVVAFKIFMALLFSVFYIFYYGGGDTTAYWDGAVSLNKLLINNPINFIEHLISEPTEELRINHFNMETGFPPGWIYREKEAWFVCKITSFISLITFRSYIAGTIVFAFSISIVSFKIFEIVSRLKIHNINIIAFSFLFMPSLAFWCSGISKDTLTYWSILQLILFFMSYFVFHEKPSFFQIFYVFMALFIIYHTRVFILAATIAPLAMAYGTRLTKKYEKNIFAKFSLRLAILGAGFTFFFVFLSSGFAAELVKEAQIVQQDFQNNPTYTGKRYEIYSTDASPIGLLKAMPISVFYGVYKPLPYEALSPTLFLNGIESLILIYFSIIFLLNGVKNFRLISKNEFLVFSLLFVVFIGFMAGFSSVLYGVLVRIRAPLLPFMFLILTAKADNQLNESNLNNS